MKMSIIGVGENYHFTSLIIYALQLYLHIIDYLTSSRKSYLITNIKILNAKI